MKATGRIDLSSWWDVVPFVIGMVHLPPLPGSPRWDGDLENVLAAAARDATVLVEAGFDAVLVENFGDAPFFPARVPPITVAAMTRAVGAVRSAVDVPVGVNVLRNDAESALAIAAATGARFIRVNVHSGSMWTDQGLLTGRAWNTLRLRRELLSEVAILADVHVKHGAPPPGVPFGEAAGDTWHRGLADALVVSGVGAGRPTDPVRVRDAAAAVPDAPLLIGSGVTPRTISSLPREIQGVIVGSSVMSEGRAGGRVEAARAGALIQAARSTPRDSG